MTKKEYKAALKNKEEKDKNILLERYDKDFLEIIKEVQEETKIKNFSEGLALIYSLNEFYGGHFREHGCGKIEFLDYETKKIILIENGTGHNSYLKIDLSADVVEIDAKPPIISSVKKWFFSSKNKEEKREEMTKEEHKDAIRKYQNALKIRELESDDDNGHYYANEEVKRESKELEERLAERGKRLRIELFSSNLALIYTMDGANGGIFKEYGCGKIEFIDSKTDKIAVVEKGTGHNPYLITDLSKVKRKPKPPIPRPDFL